MRPLTSSVSPDQLAELLGVDAPFIDALLASGVLCRVEGGDLRIPLAQLETFFRDALMRIYRAEATPPASAVVIETRPAPEPIAEPEPEQEPELPVVPALPVIAAVHYEAHEAPELRRAQRYVPRRQIDGIFDDVKFTVLQLSATGLRIRHRDPLIPGSEAKLTFALIMPARSVVIRARVVWTSLAKSGDDRFSISGLRVIEHGERLQRAVETLRAAHELQPERRVSSRRSNELLPGASDEEIALITNAMQKFASDPVEAGRWYSRGRFALSDENVRRTAPARPREREEVLGIWEYLERQVDLEKVAGVVSWTRGAN